MDEDFFCVEVMVLDLKANVQNFLTARKFSKKVNKAKMLNVKLIRAYSIIVLESFLRSLDAYAKNSIFFVDNQEHIL